MRLRPEVVPGSHELDWLSFLEVWNTGLVQVQVLAILEQVFVLNDFQYNLDEKFVTASPLSYSKIVIFI